MAKCIREQMEPGAVLPWCSRCGHGPCCTRDDVPTTAIENTAGASDPFLHLPFIASAPNEVPGEETYPWANGDGQILLRSFIFEQLSTPQSTLDFKKEIPSMEAFRTWIMTGVFQDAPPAPSSGSKLKVVQP